MWKCRSGLKEMLLYQASALISLAAARPFTATSCISFLSSTASKDSLQPPPLPPTHFLVWLQLKESWFGYGENCELITIWKCRRLSGLKLQKHLRWDVQVIRLQCEVAVIMSFCCSLRSGPLQRCACLIADYMSGKVLSHCGQLHWFLITFQPTVSPSSTFTQPSRIKGQCVKLGSGFMISLIIHDIIYDTNLWFHSGKSWTYRP